LLIKLIINITVAPNYYQLATNISSVMLATSTYLITINEAISFHSVLSLYFLIKHILVVWKYFLENHFEIHM